MATTKGTRIGIWIIAIVMTIGTIGSFAVMVLANENEQVEQQQQQEQLAEYQRQVEEEAKKHAASSEPLAGHSATKFDADAVTALDVKVLKKGDGKVVTKDSTVTANYFGWTSDGKIFDSSNQDGTVTPVDFALDGVIPGWTEGLAGQKVGSTVELTIPVDLAYGDGAAEQGKPAGPLMFIVEIKGIQ